MLLDTRDDDALVVPRAAVRRWQLLSALLAVALAAALVLLPGEQATAEGAVRAGIGLDDMTIRLPDHPLSDGVPLHLDVTNAGRLPHDFVIDGIAATEVLEPGQSARLELGNLLPGVYRVHCDVAGHAEAGMVAELTIADSRARDHEHGPDGEEER